MDVIPPSPYLRVLLAFLSKPDNLKTVVRMARYWMNHDTPHVTSSHSPCVSGGVANGSRCYQHPLLTINQCGAVMDSQTICRDFHWTCVLQQMSNTRVVLDENDDLKFLPFILTLPVLTQQNFLLLVIEFIRSIPTQSLVKFVSVMKDHKDYIAGTWLEYLLEKLNHLISVDTSAGTDEEGIVDNCLQFDESLLHKLSSNFGISKPIPTTTGSTSHHHESLLTEPQATTSSTSETITDNLSTRLVTKRTYQDDDDDDKGLVVDATDSLLNPSKVPRLDLIATDNVDYIIESEEKELMMSDNDDDITRSIMETSAEAAGMVTETEEEQEQQSNQDSSIGVTMEEASIQDNAKYSELLDKWKDGLCCPQCDFDDVVTSGQLTSFAKVAAVETYSNSGIESIAANLFDSKADVNHFDLTNYFKELLVNKMVSINGTLPRSLTSLITKLFEKHSFSFVEGFLPSLMCHDKFASNHSSFVCKLIKSSLSEDQRTRLWVNLTPSGDTTVSTSAADSAGQLVWSVQSLNCVIVLIDKGINVGHHNFIDSLTLNALHHNQNQQFIKCLLSLATKYGESIKLLGVKNDIVKIVNQIKIAPMKSKILKQLESL